MDEEELLKLLMPIVTRKDTQGLALFVVLSHFQCLRLLTDTMGAAQVTRFLQRLVHCVDTKFQGGDFLAVNISHAPRMQVKLRAENVFFQSKDNKVDGWTLFHLMNKIDGKC